MSVRPRKTKDGLRYRFKKMVKRTPLWSRYIYLTKKEAETAEADAVKEFIATGKTPNTIPSDSSPAKIESVRELMQRRLAWLRINRSPVHSQNTKTIFARAMSYVDWYEKDLPAASITLQMAMDLKESWGKDLQARGKTMFDCNRGFCILQSCWNAPWDSKRAPRQYSSNPFALVDRYKTPEKVKHIPNTQQVTAAMDAIAGEKRLYLQILTATGARPGEGLQIKVTDCYVEEEPYGIILWTAKKSGGLTPRRQPIEENLAVRIRRWISEKPNKKTETRTYLFQQNRHGIPAPRVYRWVHNLQTLACQNAKIPFFSPHCYRHYYASQLARAGVPLTEIQMRLGHEDYSTTAIYIHDLLGTPV